MKILYNRIQTSSSARSRARRFFRCRDVSFRRRLAPPSPSSPSAASSTGATAAASLTRRRVVKRHW